MNFTRFCLSLAVAGILLTCWQYFIYVTATPPTFWKVLITMVMSAYVPMLLNAICDQWREAE